MINTHRRHRQERGFSLIEGLIAIAVTSIAVGAAMPGLRGATERRHLDGASAQVETDIQLARSEAVLRGRTVRISFGKDGSSTCYVIHTGSPGACSCSATGASTCKPGNTAFRSNAFRNASVLLQPNVATMVFDPISGTVTPTATLKFTGAEKHAMNLVVNIMGRTRSCALSSGLAGYTAC